MTTEIEHFDSDEILEIRNMDPYELRYEYLDMLSVYYEGPPSFPEDRMHRRFQILVSEFIRRWAIFMDDIWYDWGTTGFAEAETYNEAPARDLREYIENIVEKKLEDAVMNM